MFKQYYGAGVLTVGNR